MSSALTAPDRIMHLPSKEEITDFLAKHQLIEGYKQEKGINEAVATALANSNHTQIEVWMSVKCTIENIYTNIVDIRVIAQMIEGMSQNV